MQKFKNKFQRKKCKELNNATFVVQKFKKKSKKKNENKEIYIKKMQNEQTKRHLDQVAPGWQKSRTCPLPL